jgi:DNA invertase Pin-like site-specific DNA recombinase
VELVERRTWYYARVSSKDQNLDRQILAFKAMGAGDRDIITDKESGKDLEREGYRALKTTLLRRGDTLVIKSLDRLSRSKSDIYNELRYFKEHGIQLKVIDLPTTLMDFPVGQEWILEMVNNILIEVLGTIAEQERNTLHKRQAEGIEAAKAKGKKFGRPPIPIPDNWDGVYAMWKAGKITAKEAMEKTGTKRSRFYRMVAEMEGTNFE